MARSSLSKGTPTGVTGPRSLTRLLGLFDVLAGAKDGMTLAELNQSLQSPKSSLLNLLRPLVVDGYLVCNSGRYRLGPSMFRLAASILSVWSFSRTVRPYLEELAARSEESCCVGVLDLDGKLITCVDSIESPNSVRFSVPIGAAHPLLATAAGRVLLAYADEQWLVEYLGTVQPDTRGSRASGSRKSLRDELSRIRKTRISVSLGQTIPELGVVAAPIFGADGANIAAIAVVAPVSRLEPRLAEVRSMVQDVAARASGSKGGTA